ncbi:MAG: hypothetical protein ACTSUV_01995 [Candidatus Ranarchaeia archaeon]
MTTVVNTEKLSDNLTERARNILKFLNERNTWLSAKTINDFFGYVHSTLWKTLKFLQGEGLIRSCRSLEDTRITLYRIAVSPPPHKLLSDLQETAVIPS